MKLDRVRSHPHLAVRDVEEADSGHRRPATEFGEAAGGGLTAGRDDRERALLIFAFFGELEAPLQVVSGNSTIIVLEGALGTDTTR
jgi:hypothetical protein